MEERWLSAEEIGAYLGIKRDTLYKWISEKAMPAHKIGRLWKFKKDEIDEWVRKDKVNKNSGEDNGKE
jgi:excisionase family DNA binding protein